MMLFLLVTSLLCLLFLLITCRYKKDYFSNLKIRDHPLLWLYPSGLFVSDWVNHRRHFISMVSQPVDKQKMLRELFVRQDISKELVLHESKKFAGFMAGILLTLVLAMVLSLDQDISIDQLQRPDYGATGKNYQLLVEGLDDGIEEVDLSLDAVTYTEDEIEEIFNNVSGDLIEQMKGENESLSYVTKNLNLVTVCEYPGIGIFWTPTDYSLIDGSGVINREKAGDDGRKTSIILELSYGKNRQEYPIELCIYPQTEEELSVIDRFKDEIERIQKEKQSDHIFYLPDQFEGKSITYQLDHTDYGGIILLVGIIISILLFVNSDFKLKERSDKRRQQMVIDYPEIVSKLNIFIGAGMSIRGAWMRISKDYQEMLKEGRSELRYGYEEMVYTMGCMNSGVSEAEAYIQFGKRCGSHQYVKLANLLEQNLQKGSNSLVMLLQNEATEAFEERKHIAKRIGEKSGTRLLMPMMMLFGIAMLIIMVPAMMSFSF